MKLISFLSIVSFTCTISTMGQQNFPSNPLDSQFVIDDYTNFWKAFDQLEKSSGNPFEVYIQNASKGLRPLAKYLKPEELYETVLARKEDYLKSRIVLEHLPAQKKRVQATYAAMKYWYPKAVFPPVYFAVGVFSTGGTITENGLLIGAEMLTDLKGLDALIAHELIHYQQSVKGTNTLLKQTLREGSADFIGALISGELLNEALQEYGNSNKDRLCTEFVKVMHEKDFGDWLYQNPKNTEQPKDMGYWMGYKITEAYFNKQEHKHKAIHAILNIENPMDFLNESGYLKKYILQQSKK